MTLARKTTAIPRRRRVTLTGLPGVRRKKVKAVGATSVTDAMKWLRAGQIITAASDEGAINVHQNDEGLYHCQFMRYCRTVAETKFTHLGAVQQWLKDWWAKMEREP